MRNIYFFYKKDNRTRPYDTAPDVLKDADAERLSAIEEEKEVAAATDVVAAPASSSIGRIINASAQKPLTATNAYLSLSPHASQKR